MARTLLMAHMNHHSQDCRQADTPAIRVLSQGLSARSSAGNEGARVRIKTWEQAAQTLSNLAWC